LGHATTRRAVIAHCTAHHDGIAPVAPDEPDHPWACSVPFKNHNAALPVHRVESLLEVKKDPIEGLQLDVGELLRQLCFDHPGASSAVCMTAMKAVMQLNGIKPAVHDPLKHLPDWLKQPDPPVVPPALWY
jgi:hypothetical protein